MDDLTALYQEIILDHYKRPRNFGKLAEANRRAEGYNPLCGDKVAIELKVEDDRVAGIGFEGVGCAISTASASLLTDLLTGRTVAEARELFAAFRELLTADAPPSEIDERLGKLEALSGVRAYPMRVKCATLPWHTLLAALDQVGEAISTE